MKRFRRIVEVFFVGLLFVNTIQAQEELPPDIIYLGLSFGAIAQVDLTNWNVKYLKKNESRFDVLGGIKYFSSCEKLIFEVGQSEDKSNMGIIDIQSGEITYIDPVTIGLGKYIINLLTSKTV